MAIKDETLTFNVVVNGNNAQAALNKLGKEQRNLREEEKLLRQEKAKLLKTDSDYARKVSELTTRIEQNRAAQAKNSQEQEKYRKQVGVVSMTMSQLNKEASRLKATMNSLTPGTEEWHKYNEELKKVVERQKEVRNATAGTSQGKGGSESSMAGMGSKLVGAYFLTQVGSKIAQVTADMQRYNAVLENTLGSQEAANAAIGDIKKFAASTPFQIDQLTDSYVRLTNQGFQPTMTDMRKLGDLAASTGKDFGQLAEAVIDAQTGEMERLKEFGIKASKAGDQVSFTFKGQTVTVKNNAEAIREYILSLGDLQGVSGGMEKISKTLGGQYSNLKDNIDQLAEVVGYALLPIMETGIDIANASITVLKNLADIYKDNKEVIDVVIIGITAYVAATKASTLWDKTKLMWNNTLIASFKKLYASMLANPWAALIAVVVAAGVAIYKYIKYMDTAAQTKRMLADVQKTANNQVADEKLKLEQLLSVAKDETQSKEDRLKAVKAINSISPEYLGNITLEKINTEETTKAVNSYIEAMTKKARAQAAMQKMAEIEKEILDIQTETIRKSKEELGAFDVALTIVKAKLSNPFKSTAQGLANQIAGVDQLKKLYAMRDAIKELITAKDILEGNGITGTVPAGADTKKGKAPKYNLAPYVNYADEFFKLEEQLQKELYDLRVKYGLVDTLELYQREVSEFKNSRAAKLMSEDEYMRALENLRAKYQAKDIAIPADELAENEFNTAELQAILTAQYERSLYEQTIDFKREKLLEMLTNNEISEREYHDRINQINRENFQSRLQTGVGYFNQLGELAMAWSSYQMSLMERDKKREIEMAGGNKKRIEEIEKKYAKKKQKEQLKQAYISMALAIGNALATVQPFIPNALIAAGIASLQSLAQINLIKAQQFSAGGYSNVVGDKDGRTYRARPGKKPAFAGMLQGSNVLLANEDGKQEYFVSNPALNSTARDPFGFTVADHVRMIDYMSGNRVVPQRATGGYSQTTSQPTSPITVDYSALEKAAERFELAAQRLEKGVPAYFGDEAVRDIRTRSTEFEKIEKMG